MDKKTFGVELAKARGARNLSAHQLSRLLGKDETYVSKVENGKAYPSMRMYFEMCEILGMHPKELLEKYDYSKITASEE